MRIGVSCSEAGKLGFEKSKAIHQKQKEDRINLYNISPKYCKQCNRSFTYEERHKLFCNASCSAKFNNIGRISSRRKILPNCIVCGLPTKRHSSKYCGSECASEKRWKETKNKIESGLYDIKSSQYSRLRKYLIEKHGHKCMRCQLTQWQDTVIPLNIHHKDGDSNNHIVENLELLCLNCHALTDNYGAKNKNGTREYRRK